MDDGLWIDGLWIDGRWIDGRWTADDGWTVDFGLWLDLPIPSEFETEYVMRTWPTMIAKACLPCDTQVN